jgi:hypothetical protein
MIVIGQERPDGSESGGSMSRFHVNKMQLGSRPGVPRISSSDIRVVVVEQRRSRESSVGARPCILGLRL